jgi:hypothetical protein
MENNEQNCVRDVLHSSRLHTWASTLWNAIAFGLKTKRFLIARVQRKLQARRKNARRLIRGEKRLLCVSLYRSPCAVTVVKCRGPQDAEKIANRELMQNFRWKISSKILTLESTEWKLDVIASVFKDRFWYEVHKNYNHCCHVIT